MTALQIWLQNHNRKLTQDAIDEALMEYILSVEKQRDDLLALIKNDAYTISFQSMAQYRNALIASVKEKA